MIKVDCSNCDKKEFTLSEAVKVDENIYCNTCFNDQFSDKTSLENKVVVKVLDPTVCAFCNKDFDDDELKKLGSFPICDECEINIKNKTFPNWVKAFLIAVLALVIFGFMWNWKYYQAYTNIQHANLSFQKADYSKATLLMSDASKKVPEVDDIKTLASYFHGIELLTKDKSAEALTEFIKCKDKLPADYNIGNLILEAKIGASFDRKDYQGFLEASKQYYNIDSSYAMSTAFVASAYACIYAEKGDENVKLQAIEYLDKAKAIDDTSAEMKDYYNKIEYRIDSKKIMPREDFDKQFPNGWTKN